MTPFDSEEFWDDLLAFVEKRTVIPVIGAELLSIVRDGERIPLYRAVAEMLLKRHGLQPAGPQAAGLYEAVGALAAGNCRLRDLYRPIHDILQRLTAAHPEALDPLRELASIPDFQLFVTTTPDDLLTNALNAVRFDGLRQTHEIEYAPRLPTERVRDIPEAPTSGYTGVFYFLGKRDVGPFYAIHEEDALEFPYMLQRDSGFERILSEMRRRNLLLIGCTFAGWLNRFFLRLSNNDRLSSDQRLKKEYLVGTETAQDSDFVIFLERYSKDSRCYPADPRMFVSELLRRWGERNPAPPLEDAADAAVAASVSSGTIFISYASEDVASARALFEQFKKVSGDVAWFDKEALVPGDKWNDTIRSAIQKCDFFVPLLSRNTERRHEGHFRREWDQAADRLKGIAGRKFIFPIAIDNEYTGPIDYRLVPEPFKTLQYSHAPNGHMGNALRKLFTGEIRARRREKQ